MRSFREEVLIALLVAVAITTSSAQGQGQMMNGLSGILGQLMNGGATGNGTDFSKFMGQTMSPQLLQQILQQIQQLMAQQQQQMFQQGGPGMFFGPPGFGPPGFGRGGRGRGPPHHHHGPPPGMWGMGPPPMWNMGPPPMWNQFGQQQQQPPNGQQLPFNLNPNWNPMRQPSSTTTQAP